VTSKEQDLIRYAVAYIAFGDGRVARGWITGNMKPALTREIRSTVKELAETMELEVGTQAWVPAP
jgi:hypothetical protein